MTLARLPPLAALRALAAFAEGGSVVRAGALLNVSHPAISQQLKALEAHLGLALFDRSGAALRMTAEGQRLARVVGEGFGAMLAEVEALTGADDARPLAVTTTDSFASAWLLPRLAGFRRRHPGIDLMIDPSSEVKVLRRGGIDLAIRYGDGNWPGVISHLLLVSPVVVVAAPVLVGDGPVSIAATASLPWLQELGTTEASDFLRRHGLDRAAGQSLTALPGNLMIDAARDGLGVAALARAFVEPDLAAGRLRIIASAEGSEGYHLVTPPGVLRPAARDFAVWLRRQVAAEASGSGQLT